MAHRLLLDENAMFSGALGPLSAIVKEATTVGRLKLQGLSDRALLEFAATNRWTVFTFDIGDFSALHWEWVGAGRTHGGIIVEANANLGVGEFLRRVSNLFQSLGETSMAGRLEYLGDYR